MDGDGLRIYMLIPTKYHRASAGLFFVKNRRPSGGPEANVGREKAQGVDRVTNLDLRER